MSFKVISFNVLANQYAMHPWVQDLYSYVPAEYLDWNYRKIGIRNIIIESDADLVCLQEVDLSTYQEEKNFFSSIGFGSLLQQHEPRNGHSTTNAILYRKKLFSLQWESAERRTLLAHFQMKRSTLVCSQQVENALWLGSVSSDNSMVDPQTPSLRDVFVACVHLEAQPHRAQNRFLQISKLLKKLKSRMKQTKLFPDAPVVLCGDFNSGENGAAYQMLSNGFLDQGFCERINPPGTESTAVHITDSKYSHVKDFCFQSAYKSTLGHEPPLTFNVKGLRTETLDFIWYSTKTLKCLQVLDTRAGLRTDDVLPEGWRER